MRHFMDEGAVPRSGVERAKKWRSGVAHPIESSRGIIYDDVAMAVRQRLPQGDVTLAVREAASDEIICSDTIWVIGQPDTSHINNVVVCIHVQHIESPIG